MTPTTPVWLQTLDGPAHRPATNGQTGCGLPATTSDRRTATGIGTVWGSVSGRVRACAGCFKIDEGGAG